MRNLTLLSNDELKELLTDTLISLQCAFDLKDETYLKAEVMSIRQERTARINK